MQTNRTFELLRAARLVQRGGELQDRNRGYVIVGEHNIGTLNRVSKRGFGCSLGSGNHGGTSAVQARTTGYSVIARHRPFAQAFGRENSIHQGKRHLPLACYHGHLALGRTRDRRRAGEGGRASHAERRLALFDRPPLPPPKLRPPPRLLRPWYLHWRRPEALPAPEAPPPPSPSHGCGGRHPHHYCRHPHHYCRHPQLGRRYPRSHHATGAVPAVAHRVDFPRDCVASTVPAGSVRRRDRGPRHGAICKAFTKTRVGSRLLCPTQDSLIPAVPDRLH